MMHNLKFIFVYLSIFFLFNKAEFFSRNHYQHNFPRNLEDDKYYKTLGLEKGCSESDIKKAYRKLAMQMHPDRGGNTEDFKKLVEAYEVLSDTEKRTLYDKFGTAGLHGGPSQEHGFGAADIARELFGAFGGGFRGFQPPPLMFQLDLSLEDLFNGRKLELSISDNTVSLDILPGMQDGMQLSARGKATDSRGFQRDLIFRINQHEHPIFHRKNADLMVELNISISEALFGFERNITMLDGNVLYFRSPSSRVVRPGDIFTIDGYGMPLFRQAPMRGNLFINIIFSMPNCIQLDDDSMSQLKGLLNNLTGESPSISSSSSEQETQSQSPERTSRKKSFHTLKEGNIRSYGKIGDQEDEDDENSFARFFFR